jgi:hypothetical protein
MNYYTLAAGYIPDYIDPETGVRDDPEDFMPEVDDDEEEDEDDEPGY